jgi:hypothetical protein
VLISARIPYEVLDALQRKKKDEPAQVTPEGEEAEAPTEAAEATPE